MNAKATFWTTMTFAAIAGLIVMVHAILTAPAYIAVPVAYYLTGVGVVAILGVGWHIVRAELAKRAPQLNPAPAFNLAAYLGENPARPLPRI